jgi:hypothetical protein
MPMSEHSQGAVNEFTLASFELGNRYLLDAYDAAREHDPRLNDIVIVPVENPPYATLARALPKWAPQARYGMHEIHIRQGDPESVLGYCRDASLRDPTTYRIMSERLGIHPAQFTPALRYVFGSLHEFGHNSNYFDYEDCPDRLPVDLRRERNTLPYVYAPPSAIAYEGDRVRSRIERNWDAISELTGAVSIKELVELQAVAYRNMPTEANADYFAAEVLADNPSYMEMLLDEHFTAVERKDF